MRVGCVSKHRPPPRGEGYDGACLLAKCRPASHARACACVSRPQRQAYGAAWRGGAACGEAGRGARAPVAGRPGRVPGWGCTSGPPCT